MIARFCIGCGKVFDKASNPGRQRCKPCEAKHERTRRPNTTQRGLGAAHRNRVKTELAGVDRCQCTGCGACGPRGCGQPFTKDNPKTGQHTVPRSKGGANSTLVAYCRRCNSSRGNR